jgi:hypothetical protein
MDEFERPGYLILDGNLKENWRKFKRAFDWYLEAKDLGKASDKRKVAIFLTVAGSEARELFATFTFEDGEENKYQVVIGKFEEHCKEEENETVERYKLRSTIQREGETFDQFFTELRKKAKSCGFGELRDSMIRDQIVIGIMDSRLREKLLKTRKLDRKEAISICKASELVKIQSKEMSQSEGIVNTVRRNVYRETVPKSVSEETGKRGENLPPRHTQSVITDCGFCGGTHQRMKCPSYGKKMC